MPDRKYENNEQELMGKERKALKSSLLPVRALLDSGSCCAEPSWDNAGQLPTFATAGSSPAAGGLEQLAGLGLKS